MNKEHFTFSKSHPFSAALVYLNYVCFGIDCCISCMCNQVITVTSDGPWTQHRGLRVHIPFIPCLLVGTTQESEQIEKKPDYTVKRVPLTTNRWRAPSSSARTGFNPLNNSRAFFDRFALQTGARIKNLGDIQRTKLFHNQVFHSLSVLVVVLFCKLRRCLRKFSNRSWKIPSPSSSSFETTWNSQSCKILYFSRFSAGPLKCLDPLLVVR